MYGVQLAWSLKLCIASVHATEMIGFMAVGRGDNPDEFKIMFYHLYLTGRGFWGGYDCVVNPSFVECLTSVA